MENDLKAVYENIDSEEDETEDEGVPDDIIPWVSTSNSPYVEPSNIEKEKLKQIIRKKIDDLGPNPETLFVEVKAIFDNPYEPMCIKAAFFVSLTYYYMN